MDIHGKGARQLLAAIAECNDKLRSFGYELFLRYQHQEARWTQHFVISGNPFTVHKEDKTDVYERCFIPSISLRVSSSKSISFGIYLCWDSESWMIEADVELTDSHEDDANYVTSLWNFSESRSSTLDGAIVLLHTITQKMIDYGEVEDFSHFFNEE